MKYSIGYNMPGFMPDNETSEAETLEEAKELLLEDITHYLEDLNLDCNYQQNQIREFVKYQQEIENAKPQILNAKIGDFVFWITEV